MAAMSLSVHTYYTHMFTFTNSQAVVEGMVVGQRRKRERCAQCCILATLCGSCEGGLCATSPFRWVQIPVSRALSVHISAPFYGSDHVDGLDGLGGVGCLISPLLRCPPICSCSYRVSNALAFVPPWVACPLWSCSPHATVQGPCLVSLRGSLYVTYFRVGRHGISRYARETPSPPKTLL